MKSLNAKNILSDTEDGNAYMNSLGFELDFIDDMNRLWNITKKDLTYMTKLVIEVEFKSFDELI